MRLRSWVAALIGREPMEFMEALVLIATGGGVVLGIAITGLVPRATDPAPLWWLWWLVMIASGILVMRAAIALAAAGVQASARPISSTLDRLPYALRSPVVRKPALPFREPPLGMLDVEQAALRAMQQIRRTLEALSAETQRVTRLMEVYTPRFGKMTHASVEQKIKLSRQFAGKLNGHAARMERHEASLRVQTESMASNFLRRLEGFPPGVDMTDLQRQIGKMRDITKRTRESVSGYRQSLVAMREMNLQQSINEAVDRMVDTITRVVSDLDSTVRFTTEALAQTKAKSKPNRTPKGRRKA